MSRVEQPNRQRGACLDLLPEVVDKYFMANGNTERFQVATAKAICGRCAVRAACLMDSIKVPWPSGGIRGGECETRISELHRRHEAGEDLDSLTIETLRKKQPMRGRAGGTAFRAGRFVSLELLPTEPAEVECSGQPDLIVE